MTHSEYTFTEDVDGNELLLKDGTYQVMMAWEKPYMEACIDALQPFGDVLEIGFGLGYSARAIQKYPIRSHTIIEYHPTVARKAKQWARDKKGISIIEDTWQNALEQLGSFDTIFFDDYPLETKTEYETLQKQKEKSERQISCVKELPHSFSEEMIRTPITHEEFEAFFEHLINGTMIIADSQYLFTFLQELEENGSIDTATKEWALKKAQQKGLLKAEECTAKRAVPPKTNDRLKVFLKRCLDNHMKVGSRFSCYLESSHSRFDDPFFYDEVILNPYITYTEKRIQVDPPEHCVYYREQEALIITLEKH